MDLLETTMTFIRDNPEKHDQNSWINECGTTCCFAGHALLLSGQYEIKLTADGLGRRVAEFCNKETGQELDIKQIPFVAHDLLGLTKGQAQAIFYSAETLEEVEAVVKEIKNDSNVRRSTLEDLVYSMQS